MVHAPFDRADDCGLRASVSRLACVVSGLALVLAACSPARSEQARPTRALHQPPPEQTAQPARPELPEQRSEGARAEKAAGRAWLNAPALALAPAGASAAVSVPVSARILRVHARLGQRVERDQPLVEVAMPELIRAAAALEAGSLRHRAYAERAARLETLLAAQLAVASELSEVVAQLALVDAERENARATLRAAGLDEEQARKLRKHGGAVALRAPIAGTVIALNARVGEMRDASGPSLLELAADAPVQVEARFAAKPPSDATFFWRSGNERIPLQLEAISPRVNAHDGTWSAWFHQTGEQTPIAAGTTSTVTIVPPTDAVVFPLSALLDADTHVQRRNADAIELISVRVFMRSHSEVIATGPRVGDELVAGPEDARRP